MSLSSEFIPIGNFLFCISVSDVKLRSKIITLCKEICSGLHTISYMPLSKSITK